MSETEFSLEVWRLHPNGVRIVAADKRLMGEAPRAALKWCGPFTYANQCGWWLYPPLDMDVLYKPALRGEYDPKYDEDPECIARNMMPGKFEYRVYRDYEHEEESVIGKMLRARHKYRHPRRRLYDFGHVEMNTVNIWTGCVFKTPPGWCLQIRSPININLDQPFRIQEGMLETDWMQYDVWLNLKFFRYNEWARLRIDQDYPLAQLIPVRRESYNEKWSLADNTLSRTGPLKEKAGEIFDRWNEYNYRKWGGEEERKDPATHHKERKRHGV
jgi:hypothetical protein